MKIFNTSVATQCKRINCAITLELKCSKYTYKERPPIRHCLK